MISKSKTQFFSRKMTNRLLPFLVLCSCLLPTSKAIAWDAAAAAIQKQLMEQIQYSINDVMVGTIKNEAVRFLQQEAESWFDTFTGFGGKTQGWVGDWETFLIEEPGNQAASYLEQFLFNMTGGRTSPNYKSKVGRSTAMNSEGFATTTTMKYGLIKVSHAATTTIVTHSAQEYMATMEAIREKQAEETTNKNSVNAKITYTENPRLMFSGKNWQQKMSLFLSCSEENMNQPICYEAYLSNKQNQREEQKIRENMVKAIVGKGYISENAEEAAAEVARKQAMVGLDYQWLANAKGPVETTMAATMIKINKVLRKSITNVRKSFNKDMDQYRKQVSKGLQKGFDATFKIASPEETFKEQIAEREKRQTEYGTGANYNTVSNLSDEQVALIKEQARIDEEKKKAEEAK